MFEYFSVCLILHSILVCQIRIKDRKTYHNPIRPQKHASMPQPTWTPVGGSGVLISIYALSFLFSFFLSTLYALVYGLMITSFSGSLENGCDVFYSNECFPFYSQNLQRHIEFSCTYDIGNSLTWFGT